MLRSTFMGFEASKSAIFANQKAIDIVGNNIANSQTTGYTKQRVERASVYTTNFMSRTASSTVGLAGQGVEALGVSQTRAAFLDKCFREEYSQASFYGQTANMINEILNVFPEGVDVTDTSGILGALENIYTNLNTFIQSPTLDTEANLVRSSFTNMVQVLQQANERLNTVANRQQEDLKTTVSRTNEIIDRIAYINKMIASDADATSAYGSSEYFLPNELNDERNLLLDELASYGNINVIEGSDGTVNVEMNGVLAINKFEVDRLFVSEDNSGYIGVSWISSGESAIFNGGSIQAYVNVINGAGANATGRQEGTQGIPYYRERINRFAQALAEVANTTIPELDPTTGDALKDADGKVVYKTLLGATQSDGTVSNVAQITAANISISKEWSEGGDSYFIFNKQENVEDYAQKLSARLSNEDFTFTSLGESFTGTFNEYMIELVGRLGTDVSYNTGKQEAAAQVADDFLEQRDSIAGVQQDEETTNLMIFQKAFSASSRVMTTMDDLLDTIINRMGRVGL